jgi:hypothetical protein
LKLDAFGVRRVVLWKFFDGLTPIDQITQEMALTAPQDLYGHSKKDASCFRKGTCGNCGMEFVAVGFPW